MGFITKLQAINQMLLASSEAPVNDLQNSSGVGTDIAETLLEQASMDYQMRGLANNKIIRKVTPDSNGKIYFQTSPDNDEEGILSVELISYHVNTNNERIISKLYDDGTKATNSIYLYNFTDDTDIWNTTETYYVEVVKKLAWSHLDTPAQRAIISTAARNYQILTQGDSAADQFLGYQEQIFNAKGKAADINDKKRNIFRSGDKNVFGAAIRNPYFYDPQSFRSWRGIY